MWIVTVWAGLSPPELRNVINNAGNNIHSMCKKCVNKIVLEVNDARIPDPVSIVIDRCIALCECANGMVFEVKRSNQQQAQRVNKLFRRRLGKFYSERAKSDWKLRS